MSRIFGFILNFYSSVFFTITLISFFYYFLIVGEDSAKAFLHAYLFWTIGVRGLIAFFANTYPPTARTIAQAYNWPSDTLIQRELAANHGAVGVLGILCLWFGGSFWLATLIVGTLLCIIAEVQNLASLFKEKIQAFVSPDSTSSALHPALFGGMHLDLAMAIFALILGLWKLLPV